MKARLFRDHQPVRASWVVGDTRRWGRHRMQDMGLWGLIGLVWTPGDQNDFYSVV